jgi:hypothetical protein
LLLFNWLCRYILHFRIHWLSGWRFLPSSLWLTQELGPILCFVFILHISVSYTVPLDRVWAHWASRLGALLPYLRLAVLPIIVGGVTQCFDHFLNLRLTQPIKVRVS